MSRADIYPVGDAFEQDVGNLADILSERYTPKRDVSAFRITISLGKAAKFGFTVRDENDVTSALQFLNDETELEVNRAKTFTVGARGKYSYNFQVSTADVSPGLIRYMATEEVGSAEL